MLSNTKWRTRCKHYVKRPGLDVWGKSYTVNNLPSYDCVNCQKPIASSRYAPHLEKCLGLSGRQSSRVASRRMGSSPFSSDDNHSPDNDNYDRNKKRKQHLSVSINFFFCKTRNSSFLLLL